MAGIRNVISVTAFYIAAFIGAGFASGQEIMSFFASYGRGGLAGIGVCAVLLVVGTALIITRSRELNAETYAELIYKKAPRLAPYLDAAYSVFALIGLAVMLAGCGELLGQSLGIPGGSLISALLIGLALRQEPDRLLDLSTLLTPVMLVLLVVPAAKTLLSSGIQVPNEGNALGIGAGILYASYNLCLSLAVLTAFHHKLPTPRQIWGAALLGSGLIVALLFTITFSFWSLHGPRESNVMPMLALSQNLGPLFEASFVAVLLAAMLSTALAHTFALVNRLTHQTTLSKKSSIVLVLGIGLGLARLGFGPLIDFGYPIIGVVGLLMFAALLRK